MIETFYNEIEHISPETTLIAVTKNQSTEDILPLLKKGHLAFGENRIKEASEKWGPLKEQFPDIQLHMIGQLQSNKAKQAIHLFDWIHSLDRISLAETLYELQKDGNIIPNLLIQVNTGEEDHKGGILPRDLDAFLITCTKDFNLPIKGFMSILPQNIEPSLHFFLLKKISKKYNLPITSMGMSEDYPIALLFDPSFIRIGRKLFTEL